MAHGCSKHSIVETVRQRRVEQRQRVARAEAGVGVEAEAGVRDGRGDRAQRREVRPPVAAHLDLEAGEPREAMGARACRHPLGIGDRQRDVGEELGRLRTAERGVEREPGEARPGVEDRRLDAGPRDAAVGQGARDERGDVGVVRDRLAAHGGRGRGDLGQQLGLILAGDRGQRGGLAEARRASSPPVLQRRAHERRARGVDPPRRDHEWLAQRDRQRLDVDRDDRGHVRAGGSR